MQKLFSKLRIGKSPICKTANLQYTAPLSTLNTPLFYDLVVIEHVYLFFDGKCFL